MSESRIVHPGADPITQLAIADLAFRLATPCGLPALGLSRRYASFLGPAPTHAPATDITWREGDPEAVPEGELLFSPGDLWQLSRRGDGETGYCAKIQYGGPRSSRAAVLANAEWSQVEVIERREPGARPSLLEVGAGELILRMRMVFCRGLLLHASGLDDRGRGLLFIGPSGAGKSTQARIWTRQPGVSRISDDRVAVRLTEAGALAYDTPWGRPARTRQNSRLPLAALLLLEQAPDNELVRLSAAEAAPLLLPRAFLPYGEAQLLDRAFSTLEELLVRVPAYRLRCRPEPAVVQLVCEGLCASPTKS